MKKHCPICNKQLLTKNKTGFCNTHRPRSGKDNPFYGKKHSKELQKQISAKLSIVFKKKWKDPEYRKKVIIGTSKPRKASFSKEQSKRIKQWYKDNPEQRAIRSKHMKRSWKENKIVPNTNPMNESKIEKELFQSIKAIYLEVEKKMIKDPEGRMIPDLLLEDRKIIIELYGDYWHFNPKFYKPDDYNTKTKQYAQEVWIRDSNRIKRIEQLGYKPLIVWQNDYESNKQLVLETIKQFIEHNSFNE